MPVSDLLPGLSPALPAAPTPWLKKCINRWHLSDPYDATIPDDVWKAYYQERAALDWWTEADGRDDQDGMSQLSSENEPEWPEKFPKPKMNQFTRDD